MAFESIKVHPVLDGTTSSGWHKIDVRQELLIRLSKIKQCVKTTKWGYAFALEPETDSPSGGSYIYTQAVINKY